MTVYSGGAIDYKTQQLRENLRSLKSAFFWLFIGSILSIIPLISVIGGIILLVGFILLIIGFGKVSETDLPHKSHYKSTRNWLLISILVSIFLGAFLLLSIFIWILPGITTGPITVSSIWAIIAIVGGSIIVGAVVYFVAYLKVVGSLKFLSQDLNVQKLRSASGFLLVSLIISLIISFIYPVLLYLALTWIINSYSSSAPTNIISIIYAILGFFVVIIILALVSFIFSLIGYHSAYTGIDEFLTRSYALQYPGYPPQYQQPYQSQYPPSQPPQNPQEPVPPEPIYLPPL